MGAPSGGPKAVPNRNIKKCIPGAINWHTPLWLCSESIARIEKNQKPVFPGLKTGFSFFRIRIDENFGQNLVFRQEKQVSEFSRYAQSIRSIIKGMCTKL